MDKLTIALAIHAGAVKLMDGGKGTGEYAALMTSTTLMKDSLKALGLELPVTFDEDGHVVSDASAEKSTYVPWTPDETVKESLEQLNHEAPLEIIKEGDAPLFVESKPYFETSTAEERSNALKDDLAKSVMEASQEAFDRIGMAEDAQAWAANARRAAADGLLPDGEPALNEDDGFIDPR
ncbi:MAG: hypothetical protein WBC05_08660 [Sedimentisphaerales bacterium]